MSLGSIGAKCPICTCPFYKNDIAALHCGHTYHFECIQRWIRTTKSCPNCRAKVAGEHAITKQLFFDTEDASGSQEEGADHLAKIEELTIELQKARDDHANTLEESLETRKKIDSLKDLLEREKKKTASIPKKEEQIRYLQFQLEELEDLRGQLERTNQRLKACEFYDLVIKGGRDDGGAGLDKYVSKHGVVEGEQFVKLIKRQMTEQQEVVKKMNEQRRADEKRLREHELKSQEQKNIIGQLVQECRELMTSANKSSPYNDKLRNYLKRSPPKRISMGFNDTIDLNEDVFNSAIRRPPRKVPRRLDYGTEGDRISIPELEDIPAPSFDDTMNDSSLSVPKAVLDRIKAGYSKPSTATGAVPSLAMKAMENRQRMNEMGSSEPKLAPKPLATRPIKAPVRKTAKPVVQKKPNNARISQFFSRTTSTEDVFITLDD